jgi:hypothetical protein
MASILADRLAEHARDSSFFSFARSLYMAAEAKELFGLKLMFPAAVSAYYSVFHLGGSLALAYCSYGPQPNDPFGELRQKVKKPVKTPARRGRSQYEVKFGDPAQNLLHKDVPPFLRLELPQIAESLGTMGAIDTLGDLRAFVNYAPRVCSDGKMNILWTACQYGPSDVTQCLERHLGKIDHFYQLAIQWLVAKGYEEVHSKILSSDFVLHEFDALLEYHPRSVTRRAWAIYCSICKSIGIDYQEYRPHPFCWHDEDSERQRYGKLVRSLNEF